LPKGVKDRAQSRWEVVSLKFFKKRLAELKELATQGKMSEALAQQQGIVRATDNDAFPKAVFNDVAHMSEGLVRLALEDAIAKAKAGQLIEASETFARIPYYTGIFSASTLKKMAEFRGEIGGQLAAKAFAAPKGSPERWVYLRSASYRDGGNRVLKDLGEYQKNLITSPGIGIPYSAGFSIEVASAKGCDAAKFSQFQYGSVYNSTVAKVRLNIECAVKSAEKTTKGTIAYQDVTYRKETRLGEREEYTSSPGWSEQKTTVRSLVPGVRVETTVAVTHAGSVGVKTVEELETSWVKNVIDKTGEQTVTRQEHEFTVRGTYQVEMDGVSDDPLAFAESDSDRRVHVVNPKQDFWKGMEFNDASLEARVANRVQKKIQERVGPQAHALQVRRLNRDWATAKDSGNEPAWAMLRLGLWYVNPGRPAADDDEVVRLAALLKVPRKLLLEFAGGSPVSASKEIVDYVRPEVPVPPGAWTRPADKFEDL